MPDEYKSALDYETKFSYTDYNVTELIDVCAKLVRQAVERGGGKIETGEDSREYFLIPVGEPQPTALEQCWEPSDPPENVHFTEEEIMQIEIRFIPGDAYINQWMVAGPFSQEGKDAGELFEYPFLPETDPGKAGWKPVFPEGENQSWMVDFTQLFKRENVAAYLQTNIISPEEQEAKLLVGSDDGIKVWLNNILVHQKNVERAFRAGEDTCAIHLKEGANTLLMKITQGRGGWAASAVVCDQDGQPLKGLEYKAE